MIKRQHCKTPISPPLLKTDSTVRSAVIFSQIAQALIIGSVFFGTKLSTGSFFAKGSVLFFAVLLSALQSMVEINTLYAQRPIVTKHKSYAFYHPFTEAVAGIVADLPIKFCIATVFNIILYFLAGLRTEPSQFFIFFLFNFMSMLTMSAIFRTTAAMTKTISAALAIAGIMVLWIVIYTGFTLQRSYMHPWFKWTSWVSVSYLPRKSAHPGILLVLLLLQCSATLTWFFAPDQPGCLCLRSAPSQRSAWTALPLRNDKLSASIRNWQPFPVRRCRCCCWPH